MFFNACGTFLQSLGVPPFWSEVLAYLMVAVFLCLVSYLVKVVINRHLLNLITRVVKRTRNTWDDIMLDEHVFDRLSHIGPGVVLYLGAHLFPNVDLAALMQRGAMVYIILVTVLFISSFLNAVLSIYQRYPVAQQRPIKSYVQAVKVIAFLIAAIFVVSTLVDKQPKVLLGTLGAFAAVLMLVFKDPILGFVAGIQLAGNNMVQKGDWISMPQAGADGDVIDVTLTTVMVQNWDKTISTIPIYHMVSQPFINWRGMSDSGGRRIKRALSIDISTIRFCDEDMLARFRKVDILKDYLDNKLGEISEERGKRGLPADDMVNGRQLTNIGTFRAYISAYLQQNPMIHKDMTFLVRQLAPGDKGLPIEIYVFSSDQAWANYENIQADIFDHLLAVAPFFDLQIFQQPTGSDVAQALGRMGS